MFFLECDGLYADLPPQEVVGGKNARINEFPYMAAIGWNDGKSVDDFFCGGVLIDNNYVLTAAHCILMGG